jgi:recombination DNA repair RAD52 pathway protein
MKEDLALITESDLKLTSDSSVLNTKQLNLILHKTPPQYVKQRPAKGGGTWAYVTGGYVRKCLNLMFGWDWSFEIVDEKILHGEVIVKGKLTCNSGGKSIVKMQFGNKDIICKKGTETPLSIGNDLKAAATDALKKCAAEIGIAADIYNKEDFREVHVTDTDDLFAEIKSLFEKKQDTLSNEDCAYASNVISNELTKDYKKLLNLLKSAK